MRHGWTKSKLNRFELVILSNFQHNCQYNGNWFIQHLNTWIDAKMNINLKITLTIRPLIAMIMPVAMLTHILIMIILSLVVFHGSADVVSPIQSDHSRKCWNKINYDFYKLKYVIYVTSDNTKSISSIKPLFHLRSGPLKAFTKHPKLYPGLP